MRPPRSPRTANNPALNGQPITFQIVHPAGSGGDLLVDNVRGTVTTQTTVTTPSGISPVPVAQLQPIPPNATVIDLGTKQITPGYGDDVFSDWINAAQIGIPMPAEFVMYGTGNPTGLDGGRFPRAQWHNPVGRADHGRCAALRRQPRGADVPQWR